MLLLSYFGGAQNRAVKDMSDDELVAAVSCMSVEPWSGWLAGSLGPSGAVSWPAAWVPAEGFGVAGWQLGSQWRPCNSGRSMFAKKQRLRRGEGENCRMQPMPGYMGGLLTCLHFASIVSLRRLTRTCGRCCCGRMRRRRARSPCACGPAPSRR